MKIEKITITFILLEFLLYLLIHLFKIDNRMGLRYLSIVLCLLYVMIMSQSKDSKHLKVAFIFTLIADLFLLVLDDYYLYGVIVFCFAQFIYSYRLLKVNEMKRNLRIVIQVMSIIIVQIIVKIMLSAQFDLLAVVTIIYFVSLLNNIVNSIVFTKINPIFSAGLILFGLCDIFVGLNNLGSYIDFRFSTVLDYPWIFYIPSQVLIALSVDRNKKIA